MCRDKSHSPEQTFSQIDKFPFCKNNDENKNILQPKYFYIKRKKSNSCIC